MSKAMALALRRLEKYRIYRAATQRVLERRQNIAAIILAERACALHSLAGGDGETACDHLANARWFASRDKRSARQAWDALKHGY